MTTLLNYMKIYMTELVSADQAKKQERQYEKAQPQGVQIKPFKYK